MARNSHRPSLAHPNRAAPNKAICGLRRRRNVLRFPQVAGAFPVSRGQLSQLLTENQLELKETASFGCSLRIQCRRNSPGNLTATQYCGESLTKLPRPARHKRKSS